MFVFDLFNILFMFLFSLYCSFFAAQEAYKEKGNIYVYANKIFPIDNPSETYEFPDHLPFCQQRELKPLKPPFLSGITGNSPSFTDIVLHFNENQKNVNLCSTKITKENFKRLKKAIERNYVIEFSVDSIPCWLHIGSTASGKPKIFSHILFTLALNNESQIVDVNVTGTMSSDVIEGRVINYTFSSKFIEATKIRVSRNEDEDIKNIRKAYKKQTGNETSEHRNIHRMERLKNSPAIKTSVHMYSLLNAVVLAFLLVILVALVFNKVSMRESASMSRFDGFEFENISEKGWRSVHGDVFRPPKYLSKISILSGCGVHLAIVLVIYSIFAWLYDVSFSYMILLFCIFSPVSGFIAASVGQAFGNRQWLALSLGSIITSPTVCFLIGIPSWIMALLKGSTFHLSIQNLLTLLFLLVLICFPLSGFGGFIAKKKNIYLGNKCEVSLVPRQIPKPKWYLRKSTMCFFVCIVCSLPAIVELHYVLIAMFDPMTFYDFIFLFSMIILEIIISGCSSLISVYLLLQAEDYKWQWPSFLFPASSSLSMLLYSIHFFISNTNMTGLYQTSVFFSRSLLMSLTTAFMCGGIGFVFSNFFVHKIFTDLKTD